MWSSPKLPVGCGQPLPQHSLSLVSSLATSLTCANNTEADVIKQNPVLWMVASVTSGVQSGYSHKNCFWRDRHGYASGWVGGWKRETK